MDGIHDLGGREGFGPIDRSHEDEPYHSAADARAYALTVSMRAERDYPIDWFRHVRETIEPVDYLTRPYFDQWLQTAAALAIDAGDLSEAEIESGRASGALQRQTAPIRPADVRAALTTPVDFERAVDAAPGFAEGDTVRAQNEGRPGHTRLPAYARGKAGRILAHRGAHLLPDAGARGEHRAEHLYTVAFRSADLWPEADRPGDEVMIDLWESYLERA